MIVNLYRQNECRLSETKNIMEKDNLKQYIVDNYMEYIKVKNRVELENQLKEYLYKVTDLKEKEIDYAVNNTLDEIFGYGILQQFIDSNDVTDIRAVSYKDIYIKKLGTWQKVNICFDNEEEYLKYIRYTVLKNNGLINYDKPINIVTDKNYNLRIEAGISPVNTISPSIVIRIHRNNLKISLEKLYLIDNMIETKEYLFLLNAIREKKNILISGKGGSGKTTLLRALLDKLPSETPITINEESTEIYLKNKNVIQREIIQTREKGKNITLEKLMKHSLVMSNDVLVVGELKGGAETVSLIDAINTGHVGYATVHANSSQDTIDRLITLFKKDTLSQTYTTNFIERIICKNIDYIIFLKEYKVSEILEVGYDVVTEKNISKIIYERKQSGI